MDFLSLMASLLDTRTFASMWYWIMLAVLWAGQTRQVMGVPHDLTRLAPEQAATLARIYAARGMYYWRRGALVITAFTAFFFTALIILAFWFDFEFAQGVFFLLAPAATIGAMQLRAAHYIDAENAPDAAIFALITRLRLYVQLIGFTSIPVTAFYGFAHIITANYHG